VRGFLRENQATCDAPSDETLAARFSAGDERAFEHLFERHRPRMARLVNRFFNGPEQVEDVVQDIFTKLYFALNAYVPHDGVPFTGWLSRIAVNACRDHLRYAGRRPETKFDDVNDEERAWVREGLSGSERESPESTAIARDLVRKLMDRLDPEDRIVLVLLDVEGWSVAEIADLNNWSASKVKVRAHRARHRLRTVLAEWTGE
jgi:RNA polymerase sigma-70 factor, ECF subfamily